MSRHATHGWLTAIVLRVWALFRRFGLWWVPARVNWPRVRIGGIVAGVLVLALFWLVPWTSAGIFSASGMKNVLYVPPGANAPLPSEVASALAATEGTGGFTAGEATALAGAGGVVATPAAAGAGIAGAGVGAFVVTAGAVGIIMRATGLGTSGLCDSSFGWLAGAYGQDCSAATPPPAPSYQPNSDVASGGFHATPCAGPPGSASAAQCFTISGPARDLGQALGSEYYGFPITGDTVPLSPGNSSIWWASAAYGAQQGTVQDAASIGRYFTNFPAGEWLLTAGNADADHENEATCWAVNSGECSSAGVPQASTGAVAPGSTPSDPRRYFESVATFSDGTTASARSVNFTETGTVPMYPSVPTTGKVLTELVVTEWMADGSTSKVIIDQKTSGAYQSSTSAYPDCASGACIVQMYYNGQPCSVGLAPCETWKYDAKPSDGVYQCQYGPPGNPAEYAVPLSECNSIGNYYQPTAQSTGHPYTDPGTGSAPLPGSGSDPGTGVTTTTAPAGAPGVKPGTDPVVVPGTDVTTPNDVGACTASAFSAFNPIGWVVTPAKCVATWLFKPDPVQLEDGITGDQTAWNGSPFGKVILAAGAAMTISVNGDGCQGPPFTLDLSNLGPSVGLPSAGGFVHTWYPMDACSDPMRGVAATISALLSAIITMLALLAGLRYVARIIGFVEFGSAKPDGPFRDGDGKASNE